MKKHITILFALMLFLLSACGSVPPTCPDEIIIACTTYPVYLFTQTVAEGIPDVQVKLVVNQQLSCLHNYTLTMSDMKVIESADLLVINGAGLEESFLSDVLEQRNYLDASKGLPLRWNEEEGETDPHCWLSPAMAEQMIQNIAVGLAEQNPENTQLYLANADTACRELDCFQTTLRQELNDLPCRELIPFHDGFGYFAEAFGLKILTSVEEEEGSEASAREIKQLTKLIQTHHIPCVFVEENGSDSAARALSLECGVAVATLNMGMSGDESGGGLAVYEALLRENIDTIQEAYA